MIKGIQTTINMAQFPRLRALNQRSQPASPQPQQQLTDYGIQCAQPGYQNFLKKFVGADGNQAEFHRKVEFFKLATYFHPHTMADTQPTTDECLALLPQQPAFTSLADGITPEISLYAAAVQVLDTSVQPLTWWRHHDASEFPKLAKMLKLICLSNQAVQQVKGPFPS